MNDDYDDVGDRDEDFILKEDAKEQTVEAIANAINEFLYSISVGNSLQIAFERAVDGEATTALSVPSNVVILVNGEVRTP